MNTNNEEKIKQLRFQMDCLREKWKKYGFDKNEIGELLRLQIEAANLGDVEAYTELGTAYEFGETDEGINIAKAEYWYLKASQAGRNYVQEWIKRLGDTKKYMTIQELAISGADYFDEGKWQKAISCWKACLDRGQCPSSCKWSIGSAYHELYKIDHDSDRRLYYARQCIYWYNQSAEEGFTGAQVSLGMLYLNGEMVYTDYGKALFWLKKAAQQGDEYAYNNLGVICEKGLGVEKDCQKARNYYNLAADKGLLCAKVNYANLTYLSKNEIDRNRAYSYILDGVKAGNSTAQCLLGLMYYHNSIPGAKPDPDRKNCLKWLLLSARGGNKEALRLLKIVRRELKEQSWSGLFKSIMINAIADGIAEETSDSIQEWIDGELGEILGENIGDAVGDFVGNRMKDAAFGDKEGIDNTNKN